MARLKHVWRELNAQQTQRTAAGDRRWARELAAAVEAGLTQEEIAAQFREDGEKITQGRISQLLLYDEFVQFAEELGITTVISNLNEGGFRAYWRSTKRLVGIQLPKAGKLPHDPEKAERARQERLTKTRQAKRQVFAAIGDQLKAGNPPTKLGPPPKKAPVTKDRLSEANRNYRSNARKEVKRIITTIRPEVQEMLALCVNADHKLKWTPGLMKHHAAQLTNALKELDRLEQYFRTAR